MTTKTCIQDNDERIIRIQQLLADGNYSDKSIVESWLESCLETHELYQETESKERPMVDYGDWCIIFEDDANMIDFLDSEIEENELPPEDADWLYEGVAIEYVLMTGVELGQLNVFEM